MRPGIALASSTSGPSGAEDHVDAREAVEPERVPGAQRRVEHLPLGGAERRRRHVVGAADLIARLIVVAVVGVREHLDRRQGDSADQRHGQLASVHVALDHHPVVIGKGGDQRLGHLGGTGREPHPERGPAGRRLYDQRVAEPVADLIQRLGGAELAEGDRVEREPVRGRHLGGAQRVLGDRLVERSPAGGGAGARVGDAEDLEQLLHRPVLAALAVQGDERRVGPLLAQRRDQPRADVHRDDLMPEPRERILDPSPAAQRHLPLQPPAPL